MKADNTTEAQVTKVLNRFTEAYRDRDLDAMMECFASDDDVFLYGTGADERRVGRAEIEAQAMRDWAQTETAAMDFQSILVSSAGVVSWAAVDGAFDLRSDGRQIRLPARITLVLENRDGEWLIVHAHFSTPAAEQAEGQSF